MRLSRLLAAGKSLVGLKNDGSNYRLSGKKRLPVFEAAPNPFRATTTPQGTSARVNSASGQQDAGAGSAELPALAFPQPAVAATQPAAAPAPEAKPDSEPRPAREPRLAGDSRSGKVQASKWYAWKPFGGRQKESGTTARPAAPVQTELSLDRIKPVRNDLSDCDFEVVASRSASRVAKGPETQAADEGRRMGTVRNDCSSR